MNLLLAAHSRGVQLSQREGTRGSCCTKEPLQSCLVLGDLYSYNDLTVELDEPLPWQYL